MELNSPLRNVDWSYIACHTLGNREVPKWLEVKAGDTFAPEWFWWARGDFYADNHVGPREYTFFPFERIYILR